MARRPHVPGGITERFWDLREVTLGHRVWVSDRDPVVAVESKRQRPGAGFGDVVVGDIIYLGFDSAHDLGLLREAA